MASTIKGEDLVRSISGAFQLISYYHPADYICHLARAYDREESPAAKDAIGQILVNSRAAALGKRPICQPLEAIARHHAAYLVAVGGAAFLVSKAIRSARVLAFADLGMEAIYEFEVEDTPVTAGVNVHGVSVHLLGAAEWKRRIAERRAVA